MFPQQLVTLAIFSDRYHDKKTELIIVKLKLIEIYLLGLAEKSLEISGSNYLFFNQIKKIVFNSYNRSNREIFHQK